MSASNAGVFDGIGGCESPACGLPFISTGNTRCSGNHTDSKPASSAACAPAVQNFGFMPASITPIFMDRSPSSSPPPVEHQEPTGIVTALPVEFGGTMSIERFSLDGKVAIVTGGAGGCGEEYGRGLSAAGAQIVLADLDGERAEQNAQHLREQGREAIGVRVDITDPDAAEEMVHAASDAFGGVDI